MKGTFVLGACTAVAWGVAAQPAPAVCPGFGADADGSGSADIVDVQCAILEALYQTSGQLGDRPACVDPLRAQRCAFDLDCSGETTVVDVSLFIRAALGMPLTASLDADGDGCHDGCANGCPLTPFSALEAIDALAPQNEPYDPDADAAEEPLPADAQTTWPLVSWLSATFDAIAAQGAVPTLSYAPAPGAADVLNVVEPVAPDAVVDTEVGSYAIVEVSDARVLVAHQPMMLDDIDAALVVPWTTPLTDVLVVASYRRTVDAGGSVQIQLDALGALGPDTTGAPSPLDVHLVDPAEPVAQHTCTADAWAASGVGGGLAVSFPPLHACSDAQCVAVRAAWIRATHDVARVVEMLDYIHTVSSSARACLWQQPGVAPDGTHLGEDTSLYHYFGSYTPHRFDAIRWAYHRILDRFRDLEVNGVPLGVRCTPLPGDVCLTATPEPTANHALVGRVVLCARWFDELGPEPRARVMVHEVAHHLYVPLTYDNGAKALVPVQDTHLHYHGAPCEAGPTQKDYGYDNVLHLATYHNSEGKGCWHRNLALKNNDTYAFATNAIGGAIRNGIMQWWPAEHCGLGGGGGGGGLPPEGCQGGSTSVPPPFPGDPWGAYDPAGSCFKSGGSWVCPPPSGGAGGAVLGPTTITANCPTQP